MTSFNGRTALITGAASGIGKATALAFGRAGANVVVSDIDEQRGNMVAADIRTFGGSAIFVRCDVADAGSVEALIAAAIGEFGRLDCAHNNAGIALAKHAPIGDAEEADFDRNIAVNLKSVWLCLRAELRHMAAHGGGAIVNTSSVAGITGLAFDGGYCAAKHGVIGLTRAAALEYADRGIRVNAVCPGLTRTAMTDFIAGTVGAGMAMPPLPPLRRMAEPEEIAASVLFLASDAASYVTGQYFAVDGGATV